VNVPVNFEIGQVVHHRRYDYRGVVLAIDPLCRATDEWYESNLTQPDRNQPWYHVLVHGGQETYVAQENLEVDTSGETVNHPMVTRYFGSFVNGRYHVSGLN
jgi:heat shock protein HspQ